MFSTHKIHNCKVEERKFVPISEQKHPEYQFSNLQNQFPNCQQAKKKVHAVKLVKRRSESHSSRTI
jgi:hypothetical protein